MSVVTFATPDPTTLSDSTGNLRVVDTEVTLDERVDSWIAAGGNASEAETLRYRAALFMRVPRTLSHDQVVEVNCPLLSRSAMKELTASCSSTSAR